MRATIIIAAACAAAVLWRVGMPQQGPAAGPAGALPAARPASAAAIDASTIARAAVSPGAVDAAEPRARQSAPNASTLARIEAAVRDARRHGKGEQEVHRLRSASMPAAQVEALARMEAEQASWQRRVEALQSACAANIGCDDARASFTREELARTTAYAAPTLRQ